MDNHEDFYCSECKHSTLLYDRRKDEDVYLCERFGRRVKEEDPGCEKFELDDEEWA